MLFANPKATNQEIEDALKAANAWDFIQEFEKGIETIVGGSAGSLSGGQKQRVAIARAFIKKPRILFLDEATSALDKVNERAVQEAIDNYRKTQGNITIVVIAHRLSTIKDADKIVVVVNGVLTEMGNHDELLQNYPKGTYADFCEKQKSAEANKAEGATASAARAQESDAEGASDPKNDPGFKEKITKAEEMDKQEKEEIDKVLEKCKETSDFMRVMEHSEPAYLIVIACIASAFVGFTQPFLGIIFAKIMNLLTIPKEYWDLMEGPDYYRETLDLWVWMTVLMGVVCFVGLSTRGACFGFIGQNVTLKIRRLLYYAILEKNIGFFDMRENNSSIITSCMAQDTSLINGASSESLGPYSDAFFALFGGLVLGFVYCW